MMRKLLMLGLLMLVVPVRAENADIKNFTGNWYVDVDKTMEETKKDPRSAGMDPFKIKKGMELMAAMLTFQVTDNSISYVNDMSALYPNAKAEDLPKSRAFPYTLVQVTEKTMTIKCNRGDSQAEMVFTLLDPKHLQTNSVDYPEYNHVVWRRDRFVPPTKQDGEKKVAEGDTIAEVLGRPIGVEEAPKMDRIIFSMLLQKFAKDNKIEATDAEIGSFTKTIDESKKEQKTRMEQEKQKLLAELKDETISADERKVKEKQLEMFEKFSTMEAKLAKDIKGQEEQVKFMERQMAKQFVERWKINKALYDKYGGRVIFQQVGCEPLDAYRDFLKDQEKLGTFKIRDKKYEPQFWNYFTNEKMHTFYSREEGEKFISTPWWLMKKEKGEVLEF